MDPTQKVNVYLNFAASAHLSAALDLTVPNSGGSPTQGMTGPQGTVKVELVMEIADTVGEIQTSLGRQRRREQHSRHAESRACCYHFNIYWRMDSAQVRESRRANSWNRMILIIRVSPLILVHSTVQTDSGSSGTRSERLRITPTRCRRSCYCRHPSSRHLGATATPGTTTKTLDPLHLDTPIPVVTCTMSPYTAQPNRGHEDIAGAE